MATVEFGTCQSTENRVDDAFQTFLYKLLQEK